MSVLDEVLSRDAFTLKRPVGGVDAEGVPLRTYTDLGRRHGTWGSASSSEIETGARASNIIDAVLGGLLVLRIGDRLEGLRGDNWEVVDFHHTPIHTRYFLRKVV